MAYSIEPWRSRISRICGVRSRDSKLRSGEHRADGLAIGTGPALQRVDHGKRRLALAQVAGDRLAQDVRSAGRQVKHVVDDLEGEAEVAAVLAQLLSRFGRWRRWLRPAAWTP